MKESHSNFVNRVLGAPQDISLPIFRSLFAKGYRQTTWRTNAAATDVPCISKDGDEQGLSSFISGLQHAAPIYEKTHVGCRCVIEVSGPGKPVVKVSAFGIVGQEEEEEPAANEAPVINEIEEPVEKPKGKVPRKPAKEKALPPKEKPETKKPAKEEAKKPAKNEATKAPTAKTVLEDLKKKTGLGDQRLKRS